MSEVLGRPVQARPIPREQWAARLKAQGMLPAATGHFEEMEDASNSGGCSCTSPSVPWRCSYGKRRAPVLLTLCLLHNHRRSRGAV
jgi:hypothetical protein